jgi:hypothetical protein
MMSIFGILYLWFEDEVIDNLKSNLKFKRRVTLTDLLVISSVWEIEGGN